jgi:hypothetical protein
MREDLPSLNNIVMLVFDGVVGKTHETRPKRLCLTDIKRNNLFGRMLRMVNVVVAFGCSSCDEKREFVWVILFWNIRSDHGCNIVR